MNVRVVERPISVLGSRDVADRVYCARNREAALHAAYAGEPIKAGPACNTSGLDANEAFAHRHGLSGDRKSVVAGKSVSVSVDLGGSCFLKKKTTKEKITENIK